MVARQRLVWWSFGAKRSLLHCGIALRTACVTVQAQGAGNDAASKAKNAVSDLSDLPNPFKGNADPQGLANDVKNKASSILPLFLLRSCNLRCNEAFAAHSYELHSCT